MGTTTPALLALGQGSQRHERLEDLLATSLALGSVKSCFNSRRQREIELHPTPFPVFHGCAHPMQTLTLFQGQLAASMSDHVYVCQKFCLAGLAEGRGASADSRHWLSESTAFQGNTAPPGTREHTRTDGECAQGRFQDKEQGMSCESLCCPSPTTGPQSSLLS